MFDDWSNFHHLKAGPRECTHGVCFFLGDARMVFAVGALLVVPRLDQKRSSYQLISGQH
jgi:hypothetical protein